jgi:ribosomal protein S8
MNNMKRHKENSLWTLLQNFIKERGQISYGEMCQFVAEEGYKISTAERRLRKSESPQINRIHAKSKRNTDYICAYEWYSPVKITIKAQKAIGVLDNFRAEKEKEIENTAMISGKEVRVYAQKKVCEKVENGVRLI